jgi:hypothetical protein
MTEREPGPRPHIPLQMKTGATGLEPATSGVTGRLRRFGLNGDRRELPASSRTFRLSRSGISWRGRIFGARNETERLRMRTGQLTHRSVTCLRNCSTAVLELKSVVAPVARHRLLKQRPGRTSFDGASRTRNGDLLGAIPEQLPAFVAFVSSACLAGFAADLFVGLCHTSWALLDQT